MRMIHRRFQTACVLSALVPAGWASAVTPLPRDERNLTGKLENGVTWMYRQHDNPPGKMALMFHMRTGSLNETDAQRGLAHFIEHMCFNGSEHFKPGALIPYFESIGMEFGADLNAFTSFDQTAYMLFTPNTETEQIDKALMVLSDYAFRVSFVPEEIEKERGVVLEESRRGKSAFQRVRDKLWPELYEGSRFATRLPIGDDEVLAKAPREEFVDYYNTWYRPENLTLVLVGDAEIDRVKPLIEKWFGEAKPAADARKPMGPEFKPFTEERAMVVTDHELPVCQVQLFNIRAGRPPTTTEEQWRTELVESIGTWIIGRRYEERVNKGEASFRGAGAGVSNFFNDALLISASATGEPDDWNKMLDELIAEVHRAGAFGFTARELELARKDTLANAERAVKTEPTQNANRMIRQIVGRVNDREPSMSAQQELDLFARMLPTVTLEEVNQAFTTHFAPGTFAYVVTLPDKPGIEVPERAEVLDLAKEAWARKVEPVTEDAAATTLLASLPEPGKIEEKSFDETYAITSAWLSNGVRVHHRFMDYKKDEVTVTIHLAGGQIEETAANAGITEIASLAVREAATSRLTSTQMRDLMTGKNIGVFANPQQDSFALRVSGSPVDLEVGLQQAHALMTDGKIEESAFKNWQLSTKQQIDRVKTMPMSQAQITLDELISGGDARMAFWTKERVDAASRERAQAWFDRLCREAPIEVSVVGDIKLETAMPLIEMYVGSLASRPRTATHLDALRKLARPTGPLARRVDVETMTPQAMALTGFVGARGQDVTERRALEMASRILSSRAVKRIREDLSLVYSISVRNLSNWAYEDASPFLSGAPCKPENVDTLVAEVNRIFGDFAKDGPTPEELENAKKQLLENLDTGMKEPGFWTSLLSQLDSRGRSLDEAKTAKSSVEAQTADHVRSVFQKYYVPERVFRVTAVPALVETRDNDAATTPPPS